jgi:hypothetical protein
MRAMGFAVDATEWPIVFVRWEGELSEAGLIAALGRMDEFLAREERFGVLVDMREGSGFSPEQRALLLQHMKANAALTAKYLVQAVVVDNLLQRTLFYAVSLLFPSPAPSRIFSEPAAARAWLRSMLE